MSYRVQVTWTILGPHARIGDGHSKVAELPLQLGSGLLKGPYMTTLRSYYA